MTLTTSTIRGTEGMIFFRKWAAPDARFVVLLAHGYGEHSGRYEHVAETLVERGATVFAPDHLGHGQSDGERALVTDLEAVVTDLHAVAEIARREHPGLPVVLIGHSMGGLVSTRYAQRHTGELAALVLSGPAIGGNPTIESLLDLDPIPDVPIDPATLSRDPDVGRAYTEDPLVWHGPFKRPTLNAFGAAVAAVRDGGELGRLPTLWLHGSDDQLVPLAPTGEAIEHLRGPHLEERVYEGARHEVFNETNGAEVLRDVIRFLDDVLRLPTAS